MAKIKTDKRIETLTHLEASRKNIPTAEYQAVLRDDEKAPRPVSYERRNRDLDPQLVWKGKDEQDWSDLVVHAPPLYIQEKIHPKVLIDDLRAQTQRAEDKQHGLQMDLFSDFNGLPSESARTEFYQHDAHWSNRMILGDSLQVMASLAEREGLRGKVQCIYLDPPYGIKFNSNFQWSTTSRDVKDGNPEHITREPEQVKAFRDTWREGIHSYLTYLRDRLTVARDLLTDSGSIFVQIGDENVHRVRAVMDEVFGEENFAGQIPFIKTVGKGGSSLDTVNDYLLWYAKKKENLKYRQIYTYRSKKALDQGYSWIEEDAGFRRRLTNYEKNSDEDMAGRRFITAPLVSQSGGENSAFPVTFSGNFFRPSKGTFWKTGIKGFQNLMKASRIIDVSKTLAYVRFADDFPVVRMNNWWDDTKESTFSAQKIYVVQTYTKVIERCILMSTDPGDLVLDPTCGSGTTAYVAEQWGRRWITIDTSRVALALARARIMGARYPYYFLADSPEGQRKEDEITQKISTKKDFFRDIRQGFVYERVPHITLKSIANNAEIDVIWEKYQEKLEPLRSELNRLVASPPRPPSPKGEGGGKPGVVVSQSVLPPFPSGEGSGERPTDRPFREGSGERPSWQEWEIPRNAGSDWSEEAKTVHRQWWDLRIARQKEIDASIAAKADFEYLYDKPYEDKKTVRVAGPFTVESLSPHRVLGLDENDNPITVDSQPGMGAEQDFAQMIIENLKTAGVQQAHKEDKIIFSSLAPWPGQMICAEGRYEEGSGGGFKRAAVFVGPEFGTVTREDLVEAAREAGDGGFDVLIACAFAYDAHSTGLDRLGRIQILRAHMNADLHMADDLKNTGKGNLFVIFGEPDIDILPCQKGQFRVRINGVDVFHPGSGEVRSDGPDGIACWFIDSDYNQESFFVRQAYFLGANDPYGSLKTSLKAEINAEAWESLHSDVSRPFDPPKSGRIAVKVINHLGDEVMKVFKLK